MSFNYWYRNTACKSAIQDHLVIIILIILFSIKRDLLVSGRETYRHFSHSKQMQAQWVSHPCHTQHLNAGRLCHSALLWPKVLTVWYDSSTQSVRKKKNNPVKQLPFWTDEVDYQDLVVLDTKPLKVSFKDLWHLQTFAYIYAHKDFESLIVNTPHLLLHAVIQLLDCIETRSESPVLLTPLA